MNEGVGIEMILMILLGLVEMCEHETFVPTSFSDGEFSRRGDPRSQVRGASVLRAFKAPKVNLAGIDPAHSNPGFIVPPAEDSNDAGLPGSGLHVDRVLPAGGLPQIRESIIGGVAVNVIDLAERPSAMDIKPDKAMVKIHSVIDVDHSTTARSPAPGDAPQEMWEPKRRYLANEIPCEGLIDEHAPQFFGGNGGARGFLHIGIHVNLILNRLRCDRAIRELVNEEKNVERKPNGPAEKTEEERAEDQRKYVEDRLKRITSWEKQISGSKD